MGTLGPRHPARCAPGDRKCAVSIVLVDSHEIVDLKFLAVAALFTNEEFDLDAAERPVVGLVAPGPRGRVGVKCGILLHVAATLWTDLKPFQFPR